MTTTHVLDTPLQQARGCIGRYPAPDERYVFTFDAVRPRWVHMLGVRRPLRVEWWVGEELRAAERLRPWLGWGCHPADRVVERRPAD